MSNLDEIKSIKQLQEAQAAAQTQGTSIANYNQWEQILENFEELGIQSTGTYEGDKQLHQEMLTKIEDFIEVSNEQQHSDALNPENKDNFKMTNKTQYDNEQSIKSNVANGTSSQILADYMKYYHLLQ